MAEYKPLTEEEIKAMQRAAKTAEILGAPANFLGRAVNNLWELPGVVTTGKTWNQRNYQPPPVTEIPRSTPKDGVFSATFEDSKEATREARLNQAKDNVDNVLPGTGDRRTIDTSLWGEPSSVPNQETSLTQKVAEIPKGPNFTTAEKRALNQVRGSVAKNRAQLKQWQFEQDQQKSVAGLKDQPTNPSAATNETTDNKVPTQDAQKEYQTKIDEGISSGALQRETTFGPEGIEEEVISKGPDASGALTGGAKLGVQLGVAMAQNMLAENDKKKAQQDREALATAKLGGSTNRTSQLGWLEEPEWMSWV